MSSAAKNVLATLITFETKDLLEADFGGRTFLSLLPCRKGGVFSFIFTKQRPRAGRFLAAPARMAWRCFGPYFPVGKSPRRGKKTFFERLIKYRYESETSYRTACLRITRVSHIHLMSLVPTKTGWGQLYAHMARRLEDDKGFFSDKRIKLAFHKEIDVCLPAGRFQGTSDIFFCISTVKKIVINSG